MKDNSFFQILIEWYYDLYFTHINEELVPQFWAAFKSKTLSSEWKVVFSTTNRLYLSTNKWLNNEVLKFLFESNNTSEQFIEFQTKMKSVLRSILLAEIPICFNQFLLNTYSLAFSINQFQKNKNSFANDSIEMIEIDRKCKGCLQTNQCLCLSIIEDFSRFNQQLSELSLIEVLSGDAITSVMHSCIEKHIYQSCKGSDNPISPVITPIIDFQVILMFRVFAI